MSDSQHGGSDDDEHPVAFPRRTYRSLIESAPDAIFFADADTGEIVYANDAAAALLGRPREEIVGMDQTDLHPQQDADAYREQFVRHVESGGTFRRLPDGRQIYVVDALGRRIPVEISAKAVTVDGEHLIHGIFRDITRRRRYEAALSTLQGTSRELLAADSAREVGRIVVEAATEALGLEYVTVYELDVDSGVLRPAARSDDVDDLFGEPPRLEPGESVAWRAFTEGEQLVFDDVREAEAVFDAESPIRGALFAPLGDHGVLLAGRTTPGAPDAIQVELVGVLAATATAALDRVERDRRLRERDRTILRRNEQLERTEDLNRILRDIYRTLVRADSRGAVERTVCERLLETDDVAFAWIGSVDPVDERLEVRESVGGGLDYLGSVDRSTETGTEPTVRAARSRETVAVSNVADGIRTAPWRGAAIANGYRSVLAVPLLYRDVLYGVLAIYGDRPGVFEGPFRDVIEEFGRTVAHAINAIERRDALLSEESRVLEVTISDSRCFALRFAQEADATLDFEGLSTREDGAVAAIVTTDEATAERLVEAAASDPTVVDARQVGHGDRRNLVQVTIDGPFVGKMLADHGMNLRSLNADADTVRATVAVPPTITARRAMEIIESRFQDAELLATYDSPDGEGEGHPIEAAFEDLTDRQIEALKLAYHAGYFDSSRKVSGDELAAAMDISPSAFHRHLREAERKAMGWFFRGESDGNGPGGREI